MHTTKLGVGKHVVERRLDFVFKIRTPFLDSIANTIRRANVISSRGRKLYKSTTTWGRSLSGAIELTILYAFVHRVRYLDAQIRETLLYK